jgi:hypothetical protein
MNTLLLGVFLVGVTSQSFGQSKWLQTPVSHGDLDVIPTGNEWIALPEINPVDGSLLSFNALSMRDRGLLQVTGDRGAPVLKPSLTLDGKPLGPLKLSWNLIEYWIPTAHFALNGIEGSITYCAPPGVRAAFLRITLTNKRSEAAHVGVHLNASWGGLDRVTYTPVPLQGTRSAGQVPWFDAGNVFSFITHDAHFAWALLYPGSTAKLSSEPVSVSPELEAVREVVLAPGQSEEVHYVIGVGLEEYSAGQSAQVLDQSIDRGGTDALIDQTAAWCKKRTRSTGRADLDLRMNRNYLFTELYAWGRTLDTEQLTGITSRSPRYYVSAAYWDRDAMLWSFPGLLDIDVPFAREALNYALTVQLRNAGTHSRFIDGIVLEDGYELDEAVAPIIALNAYIAKTGDSKFLEAHRDALAGLIDRLQEHFDSTAGLYSTLQDAQDQYRKQQFSTYDNVLVWRAFLDAAGLFKSLHDTVSQKELQRRADDLHAAILRICVSTPVPASAGEILVSATDGANAIFADVPPGSLMKLPVLGFISEGDPLFVRTYAWIHSPHYKFSNSDQPYGLPGSYRVPFTTSFSVADHLRLKLGRDQAVKILLESAWDGGIVSEGIDPRTGVVDHDGRAFATSAGYIAHSICESFCNDVQPTK